MKSRLIMRMTAPVVATSLLLLAVGGGAAWYVHRLHRSVSDDLLANVSAMRAAEELEIVVREMRTRIDHYQITSDRKYLESVPELRSETEHWLTQAERWSLSPRELELTARARAGHERFFTELNSALSSPPAPDLPQRVQALSDEILTKEVLDATHQYLDLNEVEAAQSVADSQVFANRLAWGLLLLGTCGSGAGLVAGFGFARGFRRSLIQLSVPIRAAAGQLDAVVGPVIFPAGEDLQAMEAVLRVVDARIGAVIERLRQSEREVLRSEQLAALGQMAAGMAHELRNPLTSMKILVQAAQTGDCSDLAEPDGIPKEAYGPYLCGRDLIVLEEEITRLEKLIQSFLDLARPLQVVKKVIDFRTLVDHAVALVSSRASRIGAHIAWPRSMEAVWAEVDPDSFRQVLLNLLLNALEAVRPGGVVAVALETNTEGSLVLRVTDDGCGLPADLGDRIFSAFTTTKETGLGLGLSICKRIVEAHGGSISAEACPDRGAVFTVLLPPGEVQTTHVSQSFGSGAGTR